MLDDLRVLTNPFRIMLYSALGLQVFSGISSLVPWLAIACMVDAVPSTWLFWLTAVAGALGLWLVSQTLALHLTHLLDAHLSHHLRQRLSVKLTQLPLNWFVRQGESGVTRALSQDIQALHQLVAHAPADLVQVLVLPTCALIILATVKFSLLLFLLIPLLFTALLFHFISSPRFSYLFEHRDQSLRKLNDDYQQLVAYPFLARQFPERGIEARTRKRLKDFMTAFHCWLGRIGSMGAGTQLLLSSAFMTGWLLLGVRILAPELRLSELILFIFLLRHLTQPVMAMGHGGDALRAAKMAAGRIRTLLAYPEIRWGAHYLASPLPEAIDVQLINLGFCQDERRILQGIDVSIKAGEWWVIVGSSGSGKSTLLNLIARYMEYDSGQILFNGIPSEQFSLSAFNTLVGSVPQDCKMLSVSIRDNLTLFANNTSDEELWQMLAALGLSERLDGQLDAAPRLSGGEEQRLAIARSLLARRPVLLADEPTSGQDPANRERIITMLAQCPATRLVVTHDAQLCQRADRIILLDEGRILAIGTPTSLADHPALTTALAETRENDHEA